jgi:hypothetical protein
MLKEKAMFTLTTIFILTFTWLQAGVGPITTKTNFLDLKTCEDTGRVKMMTTGDRMIHWDCKASEQ